MVGWPRTTRGRKVKTRVYGKMHRAGSKMEDLKSKILTRLGFSVASSFRGVGESFASLLLSPFLIFFYSSVKCQMFLLHCNTNMWVSSCFFTSGATLSYYRIWRVSGSP
jgi:hypothetical protein